jgi:hypothetical protein
MNPKLVEGILKTRSGDIMEITFKPSRYLPASSGGLKRLLIALREMIRRGELAPDPICGILIDAIIDSEEEIRLSQSEHLRIRLNLKRGFNPQNFINEFSRSLQTIDIF